jgi:hypothetical protein
MARIRASAGSSAVDAARAGQPQVRRGAPAAGRYPEGGAQGQGVAADGDQGGQYRDELRAGAVEHVDPATAPGALLAQRHDDADGQDGGGQFRDHPPW